MTIAKQYIGDSVYVEVNGYRQMVLTTENGLGPSNTIILEPEVAVSLANHIKGWLEKDVATRSE